MLTRLAVTATAALLLAACSIVEMKTSTKGTQTFAHIGVFCISVGTLDTCTTEVELPEQPIADH